MSCRLFGCPRRFVDELCDSRPRSIELLNCFIILLMSSIAIHPRRRLLKTCSCPLCGRTQREIVGALLRLLSFWAANWFQFFVLHAFIKNSRYENFRWSVWIFGSPDMFAGEVSKEILKINSEKPKERETHRSLENWTKYQQMVNFSCTKRITTVHGVRTTNTHHGIIETSPIQIFAEREKPELRN